MNREEVLNKFLEADKKWIEARAESRELSRLRTESMNRENALYKAREEAEAEFIQVFEINVQARRGKLC